ncbi:hypothetical protein F2Q70_00028761 [Brassica cretica]|uniref:Uncharacterized protein n=1 Tax=Brassica cretica TaxID=69181 RepID=A0A8S9L7Q3_BRACR|nr:hypothetical protein F2Q70_00028761 [Brassica cretica]
MKYSEYPEEFPRKHKIGFPRNFLGIYRRNSEEISIRRNIPRKFRGKMGFSEKTNEFRGNIIAVGCSSEYTEELFPRYIPRDISLGIFRGTGSSEYTEGHVPRNIPRNMSVGIFLSIDVYMSKNASIDERPRKYPDEVLPRYIPRTFPTN